MAVELDVSNIKELTEAVVIEVGVLECAAIDGDRAEYAQICRVPNADDSPSIDRDRINRGVAIKTYYMRLNNCEVAAEIGALPAIPRETVIPIPGRRISPVAVPDGPEES